MNRHTHPLAHELDRYVDGSRQWITRDSEPDWINAHRPTLTAFSRLRWIVLCWCGLRHRRGENFFEVQQGVAPKRVSRCTRCGVKPRGRVGL